MPNIGQMVEIEPDQMKAAHDPRPPASARRNQRITKLKSAPAAKEAAGLAFRTQGSARCWSGKR
jgi:hypothetical protein